MKKFYLVEGVLYDNAGNKVVDLSNGQRSLVLLDQSNSLRRDLQKAGHVQVEDEVFVVV